MKHFYATLAVISTALTLSTTIAFAQSTTTITPSNQCNIVEDFDTSDGGFRSTSLYTESDYTEFHWNRQAGHWAETSGLANRSASMISGVYENKQLSGGIVIGFKYNVPAGSEYRIRVINVNCSCTGGNDLLATTANGPIWTPFEGSDGRLCLQLLDQDLIKGQNVRFELSIRSQVEGNFIIDDFSLSEVQQGPLPVTFMGMVGKWNNNRIDIKWDVADEVNVREYQVERSVDGRSFSVIGTVPANGNTVYTYIDGRPVPGTAFYRVKNVDLDGKSKYTGVIKMTNGNNNSYGSTMKAYPTPAQEQVTIEHRKLSNDAKIIISTVDGRTLKTVIPSNGASHTPINLSGIPKGVYIVRLEDGQNAPETSKLIKQ